MTRISDEMNQHAQPEIGGIDASRLRTIIERIERLEEERFGIAHDIKDIYEEAKSAGFDTAIIRRIIKARNKRPEDIEEEETLFDLYRRALGM